jgi:hypothetical protein
MDKDREEEFRHDTDYVWEQRERLGLPDGEAVNDVEYKHSWLEFDDDVSPPTVRNSDQSPSTNPLISPPGRLFDFSVPAPTPHGSLWGVTESRPAAGEFERLESVNEPPFLQIVQDGDQHATFVSELFEPAPCLNAAFEQKSLLLETETDRPSTEIQFSDLNAVRRFGPALDDDLPGRGLPASTPEADPISSSSLLPFDHIEQQERGEDFPPVKSFAEDPESTLRPSVWATLRRVAALGLRPGELLVDTPLVSDVFNTAVEQSEDSTRKPLSETFREVSHVLEGFDNITSAEAPLPLAPFEPLIPEPPVLEQVSQSIGELEAAVPQSATSPSPEPKLFDLREENVAQGSDEVMEFPRANREEALDEHPFFTTMELKNQAFSMTGSMDKDLDKVSSNLEQQSWSRGSDDIVVGRRLLRKSAKKKRS